MAKKNQKLFYVRIDLIDLFDFATDSVGKKMSLLNFAKELMKEKSEIPQIQRIINEAHCYITQKKEAGKESAKRRREEKERLKSEATTLNGPSTTLNGVATTLNGPSTEVNAPPTNNRNSNNLKDTAQENNLLLKEGYVFDDNLGEWVDENTGEVKREDCQIFLTADGEEVPF